MNMIIDTILKEKRRIEYQLDKYHNNMDELPKGTLIKRVRNGCIYYYLNFRKNGKVVSKYVGKDAQELSEQIERRKHTETMIKLLEEELKIANKALEGYV